MKITHTQPTPTASITLDDIYCGTVFRPFGSRRIFMLTVGNGLDDYLADTCSSLDKIVEEFSNYSEKWDNYKDLLLCVELESGQVVLISKYTYIEELEYEFLVKGN